MTLKEVEQAEVNLRSIHAINITDNIRDTLVLIMAYIDESKELIIKDGKVIKLSLFNLITFYKFALLSYRFIINVIEKWK